MNINLPELSEGETYVGCIGDAAGKLYHVILLPGDNDDDTHEAQLEWAKSIGGDLPTRIEQAMLLANHSDQFKKDWYWSNEIHDTESGWAWYQHFDFGSQSRSYRNFELRARAVRRLPIRSFSHFEDAMTTTITLESIKAEHIKLADMIAAFEKQQEPSALYFPEATINLAPGEHYAGIITGKDGEPSYHLVLLPGQADDITWDKAMEWAGKQGGEYVASLPTRREQALLYANLKEEFEERAYWSCEAHESESDWAWFQTFDGGTQPYLARYVELRARAVRRVPINLESELGEEK